MAVVLVLGAAWYVYLFPWTATETSRDMVYSNRLGVMQSDEYMIGTSPSEEVLPSKGGDGAVLTASGVIEYKSAQVVRSDPTRFEFEFDLSSDKDATFTKDDMAIVARHPQKSDITSFSIQQLKTRKVSETVNMTDRVFWKTEQTENKTFTSDVYNKTWHLETVTRTEQYWDSDIDLNSSFQRIRVVAERKADIGFQSVDIVPRIGDFEFNKFAWWNTSFTIKKAVNLTVNTSASTYGTVVPVKIDTSSNHNADCSDIRMINSTETVAWSFLLDSGCGTTSTYVWTKLNLTGGVFNNQSIGFHYFSDASAENVTNNPSPFNGTTLNSWNSLFTFQNHVNNSINATMGGTNNGATQSYVAGVHGLAYNVTNARYVTVKNPSGYGAFDNDFTLMAWIKPNSVQTANGGGIVHVTGDGDVMMFLSTASSTVNCLVSGVGGTPGTGGAGVVAGSWNLVACVKRGTTYEAYVNGSMVWSAVDASTPAGTTPTEIDVGCRDSSGFCPAARGFNGSIDDVFIVKRGLSGDEIRAMVNATSTESNNLFNTVDNTLAFSDSSIIPSSVWNSGVTQVNVNVTVINSSVNATVGNSYFSVFGTNYTGYRLLPFSNSSGGGVFSFNFTYLNNATHGNYTVGMYATETIGGTNKTDGAVYKTLQVLSGLNLTVVNKNNGTAITNYNVQMTNGSYTATYNNQNNMAYIPYNEIPTGTANITAYGKNGFTNASFLFTSNASLLNLTTTYMDRIQEFTTYDNSSGTLISLFSLSATNGSATFGPNSTANGRMLVPLSSIPFGTPTFTVNAGGYAVNNTQLTVNGNSEFNGSLSTNGRFFVSQSKFTITGVFDERTSTAICYNYTLTNGTSSISGASCGSTAFNTTAVPTGASVQLDLSNTSYFPRTYFVSISQSMSTSITGYLVSQTDGYVVRFHLLTVTGIPVTGALSSAYSVIGGSTTLVGQVLSDGTGTSAFYMDPLRSYTMTFSASGFANVTQSLTPTSQDYTVIMAALTSNITGAITSQYLWSVSNSGGIYANDTLIPINFTYQDYANITSYWGLNVSYGGVQIYSNITYSNGGSVKVFVNTSGRNGTVTANAFALRQVPDIYLSQTYLYRIINGTQDQGISFGNFAGFSSIADATAESGLTHPFTDFVALFVILIAMGAFSKLPWHLTGAGLMGLIILGGFIYIGWVSFSSDPLWGAAITWGTYLAFWVITVMTMLLLRRL